MDDIPCAELPVSQWLKSVPDLPFDESLTALLTFTETPSDRPDIFSADLRTTIAVITAQASRKRATELSKDLGIDVAFASDGTGDTPASKRREQRKLSFSNLSGVRRTLRTLAIQGNPVHHSSTRESYCRHILLLFPYLRRLDHTTIDAETRLNTFTPQQLRALANSA